MKKLQVFKRVGVHLQRSMYPYAMMVMLLFVTIVSHQAKAQIANCCSECQVDIKSVSDKQVLIEKIEIPKGSIATKVSTNIYVSYRSGNTQKFWTNLAIATAGIAVSIHLNNTNVVGEGKTQSAISPMLPLGVSVVTLPSIWKNRPRGVPQAGLYVQHRDTQGKLIDTWEQPITKEAQNSGELLTIAISKPISAGTLEIYLQNGSKNAVYYWGNQTIKEMISNTVLLKQADHFQLLSINDAQKDYNAKFGNLRFKGMLTKVLLWEQAQHRTFEDGTALLSIPIRVEVFDRIKLKKENGKQIEKTTIQSLTLLAFRNIQTGEYIYKEEKAIPQEGDIDNNIKSNLKSSFSVLTLSDKLENVFDVNNEKSKVKKDISLENSSIVCITRWDYRSYCGRNNWSMDYEITHHIFAPSGMGQYYPDISPEEQIQLPYCEDWELIGNTEIGCVGDNDPDPNGGGGGGPEPDEDKPEQVSVGFLKQLNPSGSQKEEFANIPVVIYHYTNGTASRPNKRCSFMFQDINHESIAVTQDGESLLLSWSVEHQLFEKSFSADSRAALCKEHYLLTRKSNITLGVFEGFSVSDIFSEFEILQLSEKGL
jgi:hypothetical protein